MGGVQFGKGENGIRPGIDLSEATLTQREPEEIETVFSAGMIVRGHQFRTRRTRNVETSAQAVLAFRKYWQHYL